MDDTVLDYPHARAVFEAIAAEAAEAGWLPKDWRSAAVAAAATAAAPEPAAA